MQISLDKATMIALEDLTEGILYLCKVIEEHRHAIENPKLIIDPNVSALAVPPPPDGSFAKKETSK